MLHEMLLDGETGGCAARGDLQLAVDGGQVPVDGARAENQRFRDLDIGQTLRNQAQYLDLARGKARRVGGFRSAGGWCCGRWLLRMRGFRFGRAENVFRRHRLSLVSG